MKELTQESINLWRETFSRNIRNNAPPDFPVVVTLCGSTRFAEAFVKAHKDETLAGKICITVSLFGHVEGLDMDGPLKKMLDELHKRKIEISDEILVLNCKVLTCHRCGKPCGERVSVGQLSGFGPWSTCCGVSADMMPYIGDSTRGEIAHALKLSKTVRYLNPID